MENIFKKLLGINKKTEDIPNIITKEETEQVLGHPRNLRREGDENKETPASLGGDEEIKEPLKNQLEDSDNINKRYEEYKERVRGAFGGKRKKF